MKRTLSLFRARPLMAASIIALILLLTGGLVYAAALFTLSVPSSGSVVDYTPSVSSGGGIGNPSYAIAVYEGTDSSGTRLNNTSSPGIAWGNITRGNTTGVSKQFYVENVGNQPVVIYVSVALLPAGVSAASVIASGSSPVAVGGNTTVTITLTASASAVLGDISGMTTDFIAGT